MTPRRNPETDHDNDNEQPDHDHDGPPPEQQRPTGVRWSYRTIGTGFEYRDQMFHGDYATRHEAIGYATVTARILDADDWEVRWHESMWRELDEPVVCDYCGHEEWYRPLVRWTFAVDTSPDDVDLDAATGAFCTRQCHARAQYEHYCERTSRGESSA